MRGVIQIIAFLILALLTTVAAFVWMTRSATSETAVESSITELTKVLDTLEPAFATYAGKLPLRLLTDPTQTLALTDGPIARDVKDFLRSQGTHASAIEALPVHDAWGHSFLIDVHSAEDGTVRATCASAGPNGIFESEPSEAAEGDDVQISRTQS